MFFSHVWREKTLVSLLLEESEKLLNYLYLKYSVFKNNLFFFHTSHFFIR